MYVGKKIKQLRVDLNLSQEEFAEKLNVSQSYFSAIERGKKQISNKMLSKVCDVFGVNRSYFFGGGDQSNASTLMGKNMGVNMGVFGNNRNGKKEFTHPSPTSDDTSATWKAYLYKVFDFLGTTDMNTLEGKELELMQNAFSGYLDKAYIEDIQKNGDKPKMFNRRFNFEILTKERKDDLGKLSYNCSDLSALAFDLEKVYKTYFDKVFNYKIEANTYKEYKEKNIKYLESFLPYMSVLDPLLKALRQFLRNDFLPFDSENILENDN